MPVRELKLNLKPMMKKFEVSMKNNMMGELTGDYLTAIKGRGLEFEGFRPYSINDDASQIDWKATLKAQQVLVKKYIEERNITVIILFDVSNSMLFASTDKMKAEYSAELIASISFAALQAGDYVGLIMFNEGIVNVSPPMMGKRQYYMLTTKLSNPQMYGGGFDLGKALRYLTGYLKKQAIVIIVSDFFGLKGEWERELTVASSKFDFMAIVVRDPHDLTIPEDVGQVVIKDPFSEREMVVDSRNIKAAFERIAKQEQEKVLNVLKLHRIPFLSLTTDKPFVNPVTSFLKTRTGK
ncbi:MAG: DUF58 domain-containing protein [Candidatus Woesearchaeota archaeon]